MQRILVVTAAQETKIQRVMKRSQLTREEVQTIMRTQISDDQRLTFADDVIDNDGSIDDAQREVEKLHKLYLQLSAE